ncbi:MAG: hypothetical protein HFI09_01445 [Bacilli bacterium]|nr:hypothetical protein [Bacilli bacterium]
MKIMKSITSLYTYGLKVALHDLFYDFHSLMNNEIMFLHLPKYICDKNFELCLEV